MDMRDHIKERSELAHTYACDGAYASAARVLSELAADVQAHAEHIGQAEMARKGRIQKGMESARAALAANAARSTMSEINE